MNIDETVYLKEHLEMSLKGDIFHADISRGELSLTVKWSEFKSVVKFLCEDPTCDFKMLIDITAADYPNRIPRFVVFYQLLSLRFNRRICVKVMADEGQTIPSVTDLYAAAGWYEREVFDMFGIVFEGNEDMRRILTDYGFEGHPLRKDFPLTGYNEVRYDEAQGKVVYEPLNLIQDFRAFDFESPWQGMTSVQLPGDEKAVKPAFTEPSVSEDGRKK